MNAFPVICVKPIMGKSMIQVWKQSRVLGKEKRRPPETGSLIGKRDNERGGLFRENHPESRFLIQKRLVGLVAFHVSGAFQKIVSQIDGAAPA